MSTLTALTCDSSIFCSEGYKEVVPLVYKRLTEESKNWRIVFKVCLRYLCIRHCDCRSQLTVCESQSLVLLEHMLRVGSDRVIQEARDRIYSVRSLQDFRAQEEMQDRGSGGVCRVLYVCVVCVCVYVLCSGDSDVFVLVRHHSCLHVFVRSSAREGQADLRSVGQRRATG